MIDVGAIFGGELRTPLPVGYVHEEAGDIVTYPDDEVQAAIRDVFAGCGSGLWRGHRT
jgi:hypothetical protein